MYVIKCDDYILHNPINPEWLVADPTLNLEVNKAGSLSFSIYPTHPYFSKIDKMQSIITVYQDNRILFKGRPFSDTVNFYKIKKVEVEGLLACLNDSIVRPYDFRGGVKKYFEFLIEQHNEQVAENQRFKIGNVTVTDLNDYIVRANLNSPNTWEELEEKLIKSLGGYVIVRYEEDGTYIDYLADSAYTSVQEIRYAINLLDLENVVSAENISTCIIPYGAEIEENDGDEDTEEINGKKRVDITSVNEGVDYISNPDAVKKYGKIFEVVYFDDVTQPSNLLRKAQAYMSSKILLNGQLTVKAVDLHLSDDEIAAFRLFDYIKVYSEPHGINENLLLCACTLKLTDPSGSVFSLSKEKNSIIDSQISAERRSSENSSRIHEVVKSVNSANDRIDSVLREMEESYTSIIQNSEEIILEAVKEYVKTSDYEEFKETVSAQLQIVSDSIIMNFNSIEELITEENGEIYRRLNEISKYIRFVDGNIILGEIENPMETAVENGKFVIRLNGQEIAYMSDSNFYITNAEILTKIIIGDFAFIPRSNGNLSFKKIR